MPKQDTIITHSFTSGEWSEQMEDRSDLQKYYSACRTLENLIPLPTGGATKAPGTQFIAEVPDSTKICTLIPFLYSDTDAYIVEFSDSGIRFYRTVNGVSSVIADGGGVDPYQLTTGYPYSSTTSWTTSDLPKLQYMQTGDVMYTTHPDYKQRRLIRTDHNSWTISAPDFERGPFLKENDTNTTIKVNAYTIASDTDGAGGTFVITGEGDLTDYFLAGTKFTIHDSTANDGEWTVALASYSDPDFTITVDVGEDIAASATLGTIWPNLSAGGAVALQASGPTFESTHIGALWQLILSKDATNIIGKLDAVETTEDVTTATALPGYVEALFGQTVTVTTKGTWTGILSLERSRDGGTTWKTIAQIVSVGDNNIAEAVIEEIGEARYRLNMIEWEGAGTCKFNIIAEEHEVEGVVEITVVNSSTSADATIKSTVGQAGSTTKKWSEGSWSDKRGWPVACTFFEQRAFFAGTAYEPITIWGSVSLPGGDYHNFTAGTNDDDALNFALSEAQQDPIKWLSDDRRLIIGTSGGEYTLGAISATDPLTPTNVKHRQRQGIQGSASVLPVKTSLGHLFVDKGGRRIYELAYNWEREKLMDVDLTRLAEHISEGGIRKIAFQKRPEPILWGVTGNGNLIGLVYLREEDVVGWFRRTFSGDIEDIAIIPGEADPSIAGSDEDEVWMIMHFDSIDGDEKRYVCKMKPWAWGDDQEDAHFVDCGYTYDGVATNSVSSDIDHLEGEEVVVCADGAVHANKTVTGGTITLDNDVEASVIHIGKAYTSTFKSMKVAKGTLGLGSIKRVLKIAPSFYKTNYAKYGSTAANMKELIFRQAGDAMDTAIPLFSGVKVLTPPSGFDKEGTIIIESDKPLPMTIRSLAMLLEAS